MKTDPLVLDWLLEENNPGVRLRTLKELCRLPDHDEKVTTARQLAVRSLAAAREPSWMALKGQVITYHLAALAESGLSRTDLSMSIEPLVDRLLEQPFDANCGEMMLLRALVMLGYGEDARIRERLAQMADTQLPDGGWLCLHRLRKMKRTPKSCIKADCHGLLLAGELSKRGVPYGWREPLIDYFRKRRLFYQMDDPIQLVLNCQPGYRMVDVYTPIEYLRVGLTYLMEALAALGQRHTPEFEGAWHLLDAKKDPQGRVILEGTLAKSYLEKERVGRPTKWGTLYACLASIK